MEIESPGKLPDIVTVDNIRETRYSRNSTISRVLTEFGWVKELNEGVKRIYSDMKDFFLEDPEYYEPGQAVRLVLKNNIAVRTARQADRTIKNIGADIWDGLDELEKQILTYMMNRGVVSRAELEVYTGKSNKTVTSRLNRLLEIKAINAKGNKYDPRRSYEINLEK